MSFLRDVTANIPIYIIYKAAGSGGLLFRSIFPVTFLIIDVFIDGNEKFGYSKNFSYLCEERERESLKKKIWKIQKLFVPL